MGMSAGQARLLSITTRLTNNEFRAQTITNSKLRLADDSTKASSDYMNALNATQLMFGTYDGNNNRTYTALTANTIFTFADLKNQYSLVNSSGKILVSGQDAKNYKAAGSDMNKFLILSGVKETTSDDWFAGLEGIYGPEYLNFYNYDGYDSSIYDYYNSIGNNYVNNVLFGKDGLFTVQKDENNQNKITFNKTDIFETDENGSKKISDKYTDMTTALANWSNLRNILPEGVKDFSGTFGSLVNALDSFPKIDTPVEPNPSDYQFNVWNEFTSELLGSDIKFDGEDLDNTKLTLDNVKAILSCLAPETPAAPTRTYTEIKDEYNKKLEEYEKETDTTKKEEIGKKIDKLKEEKLNFLAYKIKELSKNEKKTEETSSEAGKSEDASQEKPKTFYELLSDALSNYTTAVTNNGTVKIDKDYTTRQKEAEAYSKASNAYLPNKEKIDNDIETWENGAEDAEGSEKQLNKAKTDAEAAKTAAEAAKAAAETAKTNAEAAQAAAETAKANAQDDLTIAQKACEFKLDEIAKAIAENKETTKLYEELATLRSDVATKTEALKTATENIDKAAKDIENAEKNIENAEKEVEETTKKYTEANTAYDEAKKTYDNNVDIVNTYTEAKEAYEELKFTLDENNAQEYFNNFFKDHNILSTIQGACAEVVIADENAYKQAQTQYKEKLTENINAYPAQMEQWAEKVYAAFNEYKTSLDELEKGSLSSNYKVPDKTDSKYQWYVNLWYRMGGGSGNKDTYAELDPNLLNNQEWLEFALEHGVVTMEQAVFNENGSIKYPGMGLYDWQSTIYTSTSDIVSQEDEVAMAIAEAKYQKTMNEIQAKDKKYDQDLKKLDTEHNALQTEYESVKEVINKNVERSFKAFS